MASLKLAYGSAVTLTKTNANLASSATAGWQSDGQDNSTNLYVDALVQVSLAAVNTAPASNQAIYLFAFGAADGTNYGTTGAAGVTGSEGTLTFPSIATLAQVAPLLGVIPYPVQNVAILSKPFSIAQALGGILPSKYSIGMINFSGMTLSVTSIKIIPVYATIA
jgi:hypothetical protein